MKHKAVDSSSEDIQSIIQEHERKEKEISELLTATKAILKSNDFQVTAKQVFSSCARAIGAKAGYVALLSDDGTENELLFLEDGGMRCTVDPNLPMPIRGLRERAYKTGRVVFDNNFMRSEWVKYMPKGHMALKNVLFSPLNIDNKTVGIMGLACKEGDFTANDARLAAAFGDYAAIALQNSRTLEALNTSNITKDKFFSIVAHDLRSPLYSLINLCELLEAEVQQTRNKKIIEYSSMLDQALKNSLRYLNNLLDWSRLQTKRIVFSPQSFNLLELTSEICDVLTLHAQNKEISLTVSVPDDLLVSADKNMMRILITNLVSNAIKYTNTHGEVTVTAYQTDGTLIISIEDNGIGISEENCEKLFKVEESFSTSGTSNEMGTGLGLILCKEFVAKHNGEIGVESEPGKGSRFWISLPAIRDG